MCTLKGKKIFINLYNEAKKNVKKIYVILKKKKFVLLFSFLTIVASSVELATRRWLRMHACLVP